MQIVWDCHIVYTIEQNVVGRSKGIRVTRAKTERNRVNLSRKFEKLIPKKWVYVFPFGAVLLNNLAFSMAALPGVWEIRVDLQILVKIIRTLLG